MKQRIDKTEELNAMKDKAVMVYRNLHFKDEVVWSGKSRATGRVMFHLPIVYLKGGVRLKVSKAGREKVIRERKKNVHAGVLGVMAPMDLGVWMDAWVRVTYNPYKYESFVRVDTGEPVFEASEALIDGKGVWIKL